MSTAAEHYAAAESCLADLANYPGDSVWRPLLLAEAQVHATLAVAAVQADHTAVVAAGSITVRGVVDVPAVVRRMAFTKGATS